jgi:hypothetical protein
MRFARSAWVVGALWLCSSGCLARQVAHDGCNFRQAVLDMYTAQIMDNLICAAEDRPFVQVGYHALQVTDEHILAGNVGGEFDPINTRTLAEVSRALLTSIHSLASKLTFGGSFNNNRTMQVFADPVLAQSDVYTYYLAFAHDPGLFVCSDVPPPPCAAHMQKRCGKKWYWVPAESAGVFLQLALKTTFMRGPEPPPPVLWDTSIVRVDPYVSAEGHEVKKKWVITLSVPVPNDDGTLYVTADGLKRSFLIDRVLEMPVDPKVPGPPQPAPGPGEPIGILYLRAEPEMKNKIQDQPAEFYAARFPNPGAKSPDLQRLEFAVDAYMQAHPAPASPAFTNPVITLPAPRAPGVECRPACSFGIPQ